MAQFKEIVLVCEDSFDGIMTAVYDGWVLMLEGNKVRIHPGVDYSYELFCEYRTCETDLKKAISVANSIREKISVEAYEQVFHAAMHYDKERANVILEFLKVGFRAGRRTTKMLGDPRVMTLMELSRKAANEAHLFKEFVRFHEIEGKVLVSKIQPKCDVLLMIAKHFSDRYPEENWIIYDESRKKAIVHRNKSEVVMMSGDKIEALQEYENREDEYDSLWKIFFDAIAIQERVNPDCQRNHAPKWYRKNMLEFH